MNSLKHAVLVSRFPIPVWVGLWVLVGGACATLGKLAFQDPEIQLKQIDVTGLGSRVGQ